MISIQFFAKHMATNEKSNSSPLYFPELNEHVVTLISANYTRLWKNLPNNRVLCLITKIEDDILELETN
jgi:hypothetical protein